MLVLAVALLGCGGGDDETTTNGDGDGGGFPPNVVTDEDISAQEEGSPGRALLEWWQAFQFQDVATVEGLTSEDVLDAVGEKTLRELVETRGQGLQGVEVLGASESGDNASVRAGLLTFQPEEPGDPPPEEPTGSTPTTFAMKNEGGEWRFDSADYLAPMVEALEAAEEQSSEEQGSEEPATDQSG